MTALSGTPAQNRLFEEVWKQLGRIGYKNDLLQRGYSFRDAFTQDENAERVAAAAAFGRKPFDYETACIAVLVSNGTGLQGQALVLGFRSLGAPLAFEVRPDRVVLWTVGRSQET